MDNNASSVKGDVVITSNTGAVVTKTEGWTYLVRSKIATITPFAGVTGTRVTIAGINLLGGGAKASVTLNGISATVVDQSADSVVVLANPGEGKGTVQITSETGAVVWLKDSWTYSKLASIAPSNGQFGTRVTMTGVGLRGGGDAVTAVHVCNTLAKLTAQTDTSIGFVVPVVTSVVPPEKCDVVATAGDFNTKITLLDGLTYRVPGEVKKVSPDSGHHGTRVVVNGADLFGGGEKLVSITLNGVVAKVTGASNTEIAAVANPNSAGKGNVVITSDSGAVVTGVDMFTYVAQADITDMQDERGQLGSVATIVGQNLRMNGATFEVTLAGVKAQMMKATEGEFKVRAAGSTPQQGDVRIVADTGAFVREVNGWTFADAGKVTSVEPNNGWTDFEVLITGSNLRGQGSYVKNVTMAGVTAKIVAENNTAISVVVQEPEDRYAKTVGDVVITADTGAVITFENGWTYNVAGKVAAVTPNNGREGSRITIKGSDLLGRGKKIVKMSLAGIPVANITSFSETEIQVVAGAGSAGLGSVEILSDTHASVVHEKSFTQEAVGEIKVVSPAKGQFKTLVTLTGTALRGGASKIVDVKLSGVTVEKIVNESDTMIQVIAARGPAGTVGQIMLTADSGAILVTDSAFEYLAEGEIVSASPSSGQVDTKLIIKGKNLLGGGKSLKSIMLGGKAPKKVVSVNNSVVEVVVDDAAAAAKQDIVFTADTDAIVKGSGLWTYLERGQIQSVFPTTGQEGTRVTIRGERLRGGGSGVDVVSLANIRMLKMISETAKEVIVVAARAPDSDCVVCHPSCGNCNGKDAAQCTACPALTALSGNQTGECKSICGAGTFRDENGAISANAIVALPNVFASRYKEPEAKIFETVLAKHLADKTASFQKSLHTNPAVTVNDVADVAGVMQLTLAIQVDQAMFEVFGDMVKNTLVSKAFLADLKDNQEGVYFYCDELTVGTAPIVLRGSMCNSCQDDCATCYGASNAECITCSTGSVLDGNKCVPQCLVTDWHDKTDNRCKPAGCEYGQYLEENADGGNVLLTSASGATVIQTNCV